MKNKKILIYSAVEVFIILMAWLTFRSLGEIAAIAETSALPPRIMQVLQNIYIFQTLLIFTVFVIFLGLLLFEILQIRKKTKLEQSQGQDDTEVVQEENTVDQEKLREEQEKLAREQAERNRQKLKELIDTELKGNIPDSNKKISEKILGFISRVYEATQAEIFLKETQDESQKLVLSASYAFYIPEEKVFEFEIGEGLIGQVAKAGKFLYLDELPQGYITVKSGLGSATPSHLLIVPWQDKEGGLFAVVEIASFKPFSPQDIELLEGLAEHVIGFYH